MSRRTNAETSRAKSSDYSATSDVELTFLPHASIGRSTVSLDDDKNALLGNGYTAKKSEYNSQPWHSKSDHVQARITELRSGPTRRYIPLGVNPGNIKDALPKAYGWRKSVTAAAILTGLIMIVNVGFGIFATIRVRPEYGLGTLYTGKCNTIKRWNTGLHSVINVLSTAVLGASSFTMQCLNSPTRAEVDSAHSKRKALDIGLPSFRNLFHVKLWKACLWLLLCLSTLPLHLFWNSSIFTTDATFYYSYVVADESFLSGAGYQQPNLTAGCSIHSEANLIPSIYNGYRAQKYARLSAADCLREYGVSSLSDRRNLIMIIPPNTSMNMSECYYNSQRRNGSSVIAYSANIEPGWANAASYSGIGQFNYTAARDSASSSGTWSFGPYQIQYCYSEIIFNEACQLQYVSYFIYVVILCNVIKFTCMCVAARRLWNLSEPILATVGDATSSFLEEADVTTKGLCLLDLTALRTGIWHNSEKQSKHYAYHTAYNRKPKARLYSATTGTRWWMTMILCTLYLILGFVLFALSLGIGSGYSPSQAMRLKFGQVEGGLLLPLESGLIVDVLVANSFQLALSTTYFLYNSLYTAQCAALEWAAFAHGTSKSLRVTYPRGQQRSTYYLHLPYRYGIPLSILLVLMHFLISQSIFLARLRYYDSIGDYTGFGYSAVGYSPPAILTSCCVGFGLIMAQVFHACRSLDNRMPIHGNKSTVISAMCHVEDSKRAKASDYSSGGHDTANIAAKPLSWGVTREPIGKYTSYSSSNEHSETLAGHCSFSDDIVELPQIGKEYR